MGKRQRQQADAQRRREEMEDEDEDEGKDAVHSASTPASSSTQELRLTQREAAELAEH